MFGPLSLRIVASPEFVGRWRAPCARYCCPTAGTLLSTVFTVSGRSVAVRGYFVPRRLLRTRTSTCACGALGVLAWRLGCRLWDTRTVAFAGECPGPRRVSGPGSCEGPCLRTWLMRGTVFVGVGCSRLLLVAPMIPHLECAHAVTKDSAGPARVYDLSLCGAEGPRGGASERRQRPFAAGGLSPGTCLLAGTGRLHSR